MPTIVVQITIGDYAKWRAGFDKAKPFRDKAGITNAHVYRNADKENAIIVLNETSDVAKAREVLAGPELRKEMEAAGVIGPPKFSVLP
jgi:hypothetical protein